MRLPLVVRVTISTLGLAADAAAELVPRVRLLLVLVVRLVLAPVLQMPVPVLPAWELVQLPLALDPFRVPALLFCLRMLRVVLVLVHLLQVLIQYILCIRRCVRWSLACSDA